MKNKRILIICLVLMLVIVICVLGYYFYKANNKVIAPLGELEQSEIQAFNNKFIKYEGKQNGTNVQSLVNEIISSNKYNAEETVFHISLIFNERGNMFGFKPSLGDLKEQEMLDFLETIKKDQYYIIETQTGEYGIVKEVIINY